MRTAINAAVIQDRSVLIVRKKEIWILPGGKPNPGETDLECLIREASEELSGTQFVGFTWYGRFEGQTPHTGDILCAQVYFAMILGKLQPPSAEIKETYWFKREDQHRLSEITTKIIDSLKNDSYL